MTHYGPDDTQPIQLPQSAQPLPQAPVSGIVHPPASQPHPQSYPQSYPQVEPLRPQPKAPAATPKKQSIFDSGCAGAFLFAVIAGFGGGIIGAVMLAVTVGANDHSDRRAANLVSSVLFGFMLFGFMAFMGAFLFRMILTWNRARATYQQAKAQAYWEMRQSPQEVAPQYPATDLYGPAAVNGPVFVDVEDYDLYDRH